MSTLQAEFEFYVAHQKEMVAQYDGRVIAIKGSHMLGAYDSYVEALIETSKEHAEGTFLLQRVSDGNKDYTATYHSRVSF